ncbi:PorP/SprF family type IX secretion system membrane protein [Ferruginibacter albus]|uniref:PorP/SprF family type IX secretion system membrane protein n=1 Tax=Ferruginibacter albus TaxID=2875540 RepID=UPI001CC747AA|nr:PorP/SprF family type IX secretion system membrane protein [Ferruginibacter albus]
MRKLVYILTLVIGVMLSITSKAQVDPHFSQYYAYPLYLNPAFTGVIDGDYRATAIYKNQWLSVGTPYSTTGLSADMTTLTDLNIGMNILRQTAGEGGYQYIQGYVTLAYQGMRFDANGYNRLIFGLQAGFLTRKFDPAKLTFGDQWTPGLRVDPSTPSAEIFAQTSASTFDAGAGVAFFNSDPNKKVNVYGGFSLNHLTQPYDPFIVSGNKRRLPYRYTYYGGAKIALDNRMSITPHFIYMRQGNAEERTFGAYMQKGTNREDVDVMWGVSYRYKDAIIPYAGLKFTNVWMGLSYDANVSTLGASVPFTNSIELSITVIGKRSEENRHYFSCPPRF